MKQLTLTISTAALLLFSCNNGEVKTESTAKDSAAATTTTEPAKAPPAPMPDSATMAKAWQDFATPGANHKWMEKMNGTWESEVSQWMDPAAPPIKSKAVIVQSMLMGGRYASTKFTGTMMGAPFEGMGLMGYDNSKKLFVSTWIDNMGTGIIKMTGTYDEATKMLTLKGVQTDPISGKDTDIREEMKVIDDDSYTMSMYGTGLDGKEAKFMEGTFKRKK
ncbi:MAG: DUF1579 domain-containing protein [Ferruginibacter sp.]